MQPRCWELGLGHPNACRGATHVLRISSIQPLHHSPRRVLASPALPLRWSCLGRFASDIRRHGVGARVWAAASSSSDVGVVIVDHGSKRAASNDALLQFVALYRQVTGRKNVEPAHMELAAPSVQQAVAACVAAGARRVVIAPYFLSRGRHIQDDIPALVQAAQQLHPGVECVIAEPIGVDALMAQLIDNRVEAAAMAGSPKAAHDPAPHA